MNSHSTTFYLMLTNRPLLPVASRWATSGMESSPVMGAGIIPNGKGQISGIEFSTSTVASGRFATCIDLTSERLLCCPNRTDNLFYKRPVANFSVIVSTALESLFALNWLQVLVLRCCSQKWYPNPNARRPICALFSGSRFVVHVFDLIHNL